MKWSGKYMLIRKLFRTAWKYKAQFFSMLIMVTIGMGVFVGFHMEWYSIDKDVSTFHKQTNYADFRIYDESGFTDQDIEKIRTIEGVRAGRVLSVNVDVKDSSNKLSLFVPENEEVSSFLTTNGETYSAEKEGFWLSDRYAEANQVSVGDTLTIVYRSIAIEGKVLGVGKSGEYTICVADENQLMPNYDTFGFVYASPNMVFHALGFTYYPQVNIISNMTKVEMENSLHHILEKNTLVTDKSEHYSYAGPQSEIEEGQTMGAILPVLFLAIAILTMVTTMHRISINEKTQIGTLKALGFRNKKILRHYTSYGLFLGTIGSILGIALGFMIARIIINPNGMMGTYLDLPDWSLHLPPFCLWIVLLVIIFMTFISFLSVKTILKGTAAEALRVYTPKKMKPLQLEKTHMWKKLSFGTRWNLRDLFRHKTRSVMTMIGIIGCMLLLVGGFGMKDTMDGFLSLIDDVYNYNTRINITEDASHDDVFAFATSVNGDMLASSSIQVEDKAVSLEIYDVTHDLVRFINEDNDCVTLGDDGAYICLRLAKDYAIGDTIEISPYGSSESYTIRVAGILRSIMSENIVMTETYAKSVNIPYHMNAVFTDKPEIEINDASYIAGKQTKDALISSYDTFMEVMNSMVVIFVFAAVVLGSVVLYNLGVMSYIERSRELATLKVVGFRDKHIGKILISQNIWLTILGVMIGLPSGIGVLHILIISLMSEYELKLTMGILTYFVSTLLTFGVSLVVGLFVAKKNKKIDMVEALKGIE